MTPARAAIVAALVAAVAAAGAQPGPGAHAEGRAVEIPGAPGCEAAGTCYLPPAITVAPGTTVTWVNSDSEAHTVTADAPAGGISGEFASGLILRGESFSHEFGEPGEHPYYCLVHPWMAGAVTVAGNEAAGGDRAHPGAGGRGPAPRHTPAALEGVRAIGALLDGARSEHEGGNALRALEHIAKASAKEMVFVERGLAAIGLLDLSHDIDSALYILWLALYSLHLGDPRSPPDFAGAASQLALAEAALEGTPAPAADGAWHPRLHVYVDSAPGSSFSGAQVVELLFTPPEISLPDGLFPSYLLSIHGSLGTAPTITGETSALYRDFMPLVRTTDGGWSAYVSDRAGAARADAASLAPGTGSDFGTICSAPNAEKILFAAVDPDFLTLFPSPRHSTVFGQPAAVALPASTAIRYEVTEEGAEGAMGAAPAPMGSCMTDSLVSASFGAPPPPGSRPTAKGVYYYMLGGAANSVVHDAKPVHIPARTGSGDYTTLGGLADIPPSIDAAEARVRAASLWPFVLLYDFSDGEVLVRYYEDGREPRYTELRYGPAGPGPARAESWPGTRAVDLSSMRMSSLGDGHMVHVGLGAEPAAGSPLRVLVEVTDAAGRPAPGANYDVEVTRRGETLASARGVHDANADLRPMVVSTPPLRSAGPVDVAVAFGGFGAPGGEMAGPAGATVGFRQVSAVAEPAAPLPRVGLGDVAVTDAHGNAATRAAVGERLLVSSRITNGAGAAQGYAHIVQVSGPGGSVESLTWAGGTLAAGASAAPSSSWTPLRQGAHEVSVMVWGSAESPVPLSPKEVVRVEVGPQPAARGAAG